MHKVVAEKADPPLLPPPVAAAEVETASLPRLQPVVVAADLRLPLNLLLPEAAVVVVNPHLPNPHPLEVVAAVAVNLRLLRPVAAEDNRHLLPHVVAVADLRLPRKTIPRARPRSPLRPETIKAVRAEVARPEAAVANRLLLLSVTTATAAVTPAPVEAAVAVVNPLLLQSVTTEMAAQAVAAETLARLAAAAVNPSRPNTKTVVAADVATVARRATTMVKSDLRFVSNAAALVAATSTIRPTRTRIRAAAATTATRCPRLR